MGRLEVLTARDRVLPPRSAWRGARRRRHVAGARQERRQGAAAAAVAKEGVQGCREVGGHHDGSQRRQAAGSAAAPASRAPGGRTGRGARAAVAAAEAAADCPAIVFPSQWGLPVLSHSASTTSSRNSRLRAFYLDRSLSAGSSSGTRGSPC